MLYHLHGMSGLLFAVTFKMMILFSPLNDTRLR